MRNVSVPLILSLLLAVLIAAGCEGRDEAPERGAGSPYLAGQLLVATPRIDDPRFQRAVIYMVAHDADGAFGLIVNRVYGEGPLDRLLAGLGVGAGAPSKSIRVHYGGPVEPGRGFVLHGTDYDGPSTRRLGGGVALSTGRDILEAMAAGVGPSQRIFLFGYAGWGPGQLEGEFAREDWMTAPAEATLLFGERPDRLWERVGEKAGYPL